MGSETCERISSPANTREKPQQIFKVPLHTIDTKNLFIYVSGKLKIPKTDYEDINSEEVKMFEPVLRGESFDAVLVQGESSGSGGIIVVENNWEDF